MDYPGKVITKNQVTPTQISATGVWTLDDAAAATRNNNWPVAGVPNPISKSLRFNSADSAYLNRTPAANGTRTIWTISFWLKRTTLATNGSLFGAGTNGSNYFLFYMTNGDVIRCEEAVSGVNTWNIVTTPVYRDPSSWYHIVFAFDSTQATSSNRIKLYVNGSQITAFSTATYPTQNLNSSYWNATSSHNIGAAIAAGVAYGNGYMTEINFIDGQALTPSSFGMTDPVTGVWEPLKYSGTYGTNGFYLNFKDATSTTTLGLDYSGNSNTWTTNNFSVTAGAGNDSLTDVPTPWIVYNTTGDVGGVVRGNYATLNPLASVSSPPTFANGNLEATGPSSGVGVCQTTVAATSGKFYAEVTVTRTSDRLDLGIMGSGVSMTTTNYLGTDTNTIAYLTSTGVIRKDNTNNQTGLATCTTGDVVGMTVDMDTGSIQFYKNNATVGTAVSFTPSSYGAFLFAQTTSFNTSKGTWNFGQRPFAYTPPSGFLSLCTTNLPASTVLKGSEYMNVVTYAGSASQQTIDSNLSILDFAWIKNRTAARDHIVVDTVRGGSPMLTLYPSFTYADDNTSPNYNPTSISGSSIVLGGAKLGINNSGENFVLWGWNAGGSTVTNTSGTISAQVRASTTSGFSIVTYTGNGSSSQTFGHGLGVAPNMVIIKSRNNADNWRVFHSSVSGGNTLTLNTTAAAAAPGFWPSNPSSTVVFIGTDSSVNSNTWTYVAYCFAAVPGYSAFGSYTGNGSADGPFVYTGFRPRYVMIKRTDSTSDWTIYDTSRSTYNQMNLALYANLSNAEGTTIIVIDTVSNGIKIRNSNADTNASGGTYIYATFAESPFQFANAR